MRINFGQADYLPALAWVWRVGVCSGSVRQKYKYITKVSSN
jgi:hypothetical protein